MSLQKGFVAEDLARDYLLRQGLVLKTSNYRSRMGEIDLIMQDGAYLVFVEVRARSVATFGSAAETVTVSKQRKIIKAATYYLQCHATQHQFACRFDVVALEGHPPTINWIQNAFGW
jgi:putative endonuclease